MRRFGSLVKILRNNAYSNQIASYKSAVAIERYGANMFDCVAVVMEPFIVNRMM